MTLISMTGFADLAGASAGSSWNWEARSVNGRGLDLRLRLPEGLEALEAPLRAALGQTFHRGSVSVADSVERKDCSFLSNFICHKVGSSMESVSLET